MKSPVSRVSGGLLLVMLLGCVDTERLYVGALSLALGSLGAILLLILVVRGWRRRRRERSAEHASGKRLGRVFDGCVVAVSILVCIVGMLGLVRVPLRGVPMAFPLYLVLFATPALFIAALFVLAHERRWPWRALVPGVALYAVLFVFVGVAYRPGIRIPDGEAVELAVSRAGVCERFEGGQVVCRGRHQGNPGRWPIPIDVAPARGLHAAGVVACAETSRGAWCWDGPRPERFCEGATSVAAFGLGAACEIGDDRKAFTGEGDVAMWELARVPLRRFAMSSWAASGARACAIDELGDVHCATRRVLERGGGMQREPALSPAEGVVLHGRHACSWFESTVRCDLSWLGDETGFDARVESLTLGPGHACALSAGGVYCWGRGRAGVLGVGVVDHNAPVRVELAGPVRQLDGASEFTCALTAEGSRCWGVLPPRVRYRERSQVDRRTDLGALLDVFGQRRFRDRPSALAGP